MTKVTVCVDLEEARYRAYSEEARRRGLSLEELLDRVIRRLFAEQARSVREEEADHPIVFP